VSEQRKAHDDTIRSVASVAGTIAIAGLVCLLPLIPSVHAVLRVSVLDVVVAMSVFAVVSIVGAFITPRFPRQTRIGDIHDSIETVVVESTVLWLVYASGRADSFFWVLWMAHAMIVGNSGVRLRANFLAFVFPPLVVAIAFLVGRHDGGGAALSVVIGALGAYMCWLSGTVAQRLATVDAERSRLAAELADVKVREERQRIARDIHDGLGSDLAAIDWKLRGLKGDAKISGEVDEIVARLGNGASELRSIVWALRSPERKWSEIVDYVRTRATDLCGDRITLELTAEGDGDVARPGELAIDFLRTVMELVHNAVRHADATHISVKIASKDHMLSAIVEDDGKGLPADVAARDEGGIANLRARVKRTNGTFEHGARAPQGTRFALSLAV
jgi:signal transduction histidine kinase